MTQAQRMPSMENSARNLLLNQRVSTESPFVSPDVWKACGARVQPFDGPVFVGVDLSARLDLTAAVIVGEVDGVWQVVPYFWSPSDGLADRARRDRSPYVEWHRQGLLRTTPGASVDYSFVAAELAEILSDLDVRAVSFDRWRFDLLKKEFDAIGVDLPLIPHGQGFRDMTGSLEATEIALLNKRMAHGNHPVLTMCMANSTVTRDSADGKKLDKSRSTGRIDGAVALCMAMGAAAKDAHEQTFDLDAFTFV
jgi:phage terminase large subunit-like protein